MCKKKAFDFHIKKITIFVLNYVKCLYSTRKKQGRPRDALNIQRKVIANLQFLNIYNNYLGCFISRPVFYLYSKNISLSVLKINKNFTGKCVITVISE